MKGIKISLLSIIFLFSQVIVSQCNIPSFIPNADFESNTSCPNVAGQYANLTDWEVISGAAGDYYACGYSNIVGTYNPPPAPANGDGYIGIANNSTGFKLYGASCLTTSLVGGTDYVFQFDIVAATGSGVFTGSSSSPNFTMVIYGNTNCPSPAYTGVGCPPAASGWVVLATQVINTSTTAWNTESITFTAPSNISSVAFGPDCNNAPLGSGMCSGVCYNYYYLDNAILNEVTIFPTVDAGLDVTNDCVTLTNTLGASATGGTAAFNYSWTPIAGLNNPNISNPIANPAATTNYSVTVTDNNGCTDTDAMTVTVDVALPPANAGPDVTIDCATPNTVLNATGGVSYAWSPVAGLSDPAVFNPTAEPLVTTTYTVTVTGANGCTDTDDVTITVDKTDPVANAGPDHGTTCAAPNAPLSASGGVSYSWSPNVALSNPNIANPLATPPVTTTYTVTVTAANGCTDTDDATVTINDVTPLSDAGIDQDLCGSYSVAMTATAPPGNTFSWIEDSFYGNPSAVTVSNGSDPSATMSGLVEGSYQMIWVVSNNTCPPVTDTMIINVYDTPISNAGSDQNLCATYTTNLAGNTPGGTSTGVWTADATFGNPSVVTFANTASATSNILGLVEGSYQFIWTVSNGTCADAVDIVRINVYDTPVSTASVDQDLCNVYTTNLAGNLPAGTSTGLWIESASHTQPSTVTFADATVNSTNISNLQEGTYKLVWVVSNGSCTDAMDTVIVNVYDQPTANASVDQDLCNIYTATLNGNPALGTASGLWTEDANFSNPVGLVFTNNTSATTTINGLVEGSYQLIWTVSNGTCTDATDTVLINVYNLPTANAGFDIDLCSQYDTTLLGNSNVGSAVGIWSEDLTFGNPSAVNFTDVNDFQTPISGLQEGVYQLVWTVSNGTCTSTSDTVQVKVYDQPFSNAGIDQDLCATYSTNLNGNVPAGLSAGQWLMPTTMPNPNVATFADVTSPTTSISGLIEGSYQFLWLVSNGTCLPDVDTVIVNVYDTPVSNAGIDSSFCGATSMVLYADTALGTSEGTWTEDPSFGNPSVITFVDDHNQLTNASGFVEGIYQLVWTVANGNCADATDTVKLFFYNQPTSNAGVDQNLCDVFTTTLDGNVPLTSATGLWIDEPTLLNPSAVIFADATDPVTSISNLIEGTYQLIWQVSNGNCTPELDTVLINVYDLPTANAGIDQELCDTVATTLVADALIGTTTGEWTIDQNFGNPSTAIFSDSSLINSEVSGLIEGQYQFIWTVSNGNCAAVADTVLIKVYDQPLANAGIDQEFCEIYTTNFAAVSQPGIATGQWTQHPANPTLVIITDDVDAHSAVSGFSEGAYLFIWTVSNGVCADDMDTVKISIYNNPVADAGIDIDLCNVYSTALAAVDPAGTATGEWTLDVNFTNPSSVVFADSSVETTTVSNLEEGTYNLIWIASNGTCPSDEDSVIVNVYDQPLALAGADIYLCDELFTFLDAAGNVGTATGLWTTDAAYSYPSVPNFINDIVDTTEIDNLVQGDYPLIWTISNGTCPDDMDTVVVFNQERPIAYGYYPLEVCNNLCFEVKDTSYAPIGETISSLEWIIDGNTFNRSDTTICIQDEGTYDIDFMVVASNGCVDSMIGNPPLVVNPSPFAGFDLEHDGDSLVEVQALDVINTASADVISHVYTFDTGDTISDDSFIYIYELTGDYYVTQWVENQFGCRDSIEHFQHVGKRTGVYVPNTFTPNGDGVNDMFGPITRGISDDLYNFKIFNRWGEVLFNTDVPNKAWDGYFKGRVVQDGSYVWKLTYLYEDDEDLQEISGHVIVYKYKR